MTSWPHLKGLKSCIKFDFRSPIFKPLCVVHFSILPVYVFFCRAIPLKCKFLRGRIVEGYLCLASLDFNFHSQLVRNMLFICSFMQF